MLIGYTRVSTPEQNIERQTELMKQLGVEKVYIDKASGKDTNRPELQKMMKFIRSGDTVVVESLSRFGRNTRDLLTLVEELTSKEVEFVSQKEAINTTTPSGRFVLTVFAAMAELERAYIRQRQHEGIEIAKKKGVYKGRKRIERDNFHEVYLLWISKEITAVQAMKKLNLSKSTFYRRVKEMKAENCCKHPIIFD